MKYRQKGRWLSSREYTIEEKGIRIISKSFVGSSSKFFDFHHIGKTFIRKRRRGWYSLAVALLFLGGALWLSSGAYQGDFKIILTAGSIVHFLLFLYFFFTGKKYLYLKNEQYNLSIKFLDNNPSEEELITFIGHIKKAQRIRLQRLYLNIDLNISYQEYRDNIEWLLENDFLSREEAEQRLGEANFS